MLNSGSVSDDEIENVAEQKRSKVIPLRGCDDATDSVYLLDDSHICRNSRFSTPDGKQAGSGQLLSVLRDFAEIRSTAWVVFLAIPTRSSVAAPRNRCFLVNQRKHGD